MTTTSIKAGIRVEWRSHGNRRPFVFFKGKVLDVPTTGPWVGKALVDDGSYLNPRAVDVTKLVPIAPPRYSFAGRSA